MKRIQPYFFDRFACIAGACTDSCCIGWEIDIDKDSLAHYRAQTGEFGERLQREIVTEKGVSHFCLKEKERCAFLNEDNLCDLYIALGEEALCDICREHPRFYEWFGDRVEAGLGLCCEEACRLLLAEEAPLTFAETQDEQPEEDFEGDEEWLELLQETRQNAFALLQDRSKTMEERLEGFMQLVNAAQDEMDGFAPMEEYETEVPDDAQLLKLCTELEPIDESWTQRVKRMEAAQDRPVCIPEWQLEHAAVYLTYRWLLKAAFDGDALGKGRLVVTFVRLIGLLMRKGGADSVEEALRILSKEIEYSQENTDAVQAWEL